MFSLPRIIGVIAILLLVGSVLAWIYRQGADDIIQSIERQDNEAGGKADRARADYDWCLDRGGLWNFGAGKCTGLSPGDRH